MTVLDKAIQLATKYHSGQIDKMGMPYILHPLTVMLNVDNGIGRIANIKRIVAVLHDVVEDCDVQLSSLMTELMEECPELLHEDYTRVHNALAVITHEKSTPYMQYIRTLRDNEIARCVKIADMEHNMSPERMDKLPFEEQDRLQKKYKKAYTYLTGVKKTETI